LADFCFGFVASIPVPESRPHREVTNQCVLELSSSRLSPYLVGSIQAECIADFDSHFFGSSFPYRVVKAFERGHFFGLGVAEEFGGRRTTEDWRLGSLRVTVSPALYLRFAGVRGRTDDSLPSFAASSGLSGSHVESVSVSSLSPHRPLPIPLPLIHATSPLPLLYFRRILFPFSSSSILLPSSAFSPSRSPTVHLSLSLSFSSYLFTTSLAYHEPNALMIMINSALAPLLRLTRRRVDCKQSSDRPLFTSLSSARRDKRAGAGNPET